MNSDDKEQLQHKAKRERTAKEKKKNEEVNSIKGINECDILMKENKSVAEKKKEECLTVGCML